MQIDLEKAVREGGSLEAKIPPLILDWDGVKPIDAGPALLRGRLLRVRRGFDFAADLVGSLMIDCVRCLEPFQIDLAFDFHLLFILGEAAPAEGHEHQVQEAECDLYPCEDDKVDLFNVAREQMYLHVPLKPVCRESCLGLCLVCGENLNQSPCRCGQPARVRVV